MTYKNGQGIVNFMSDEEQKKQQQQATGGQLTGGIVGAAGTTLSPPPEAGSKDITGPVGSSITNPMGMTGAGGWGNPTPAQPTQAEGASSDPNRSPEKQALITQLMQRAQQGTAIDRNDPAVRAQADAYVSQEERARRNYLADAAEKGSPYNTGQQAGLERMTAESLGQRAGQFESELVNRELTARRDEVENALKQWGDTLSDEEKQGLERELAEMNATIERSKVGNQNTQFYAGLNQQEKQFADQLTQGERFKNMDDAYNRYQLAAENGQFYSKLAQDGDLNRLQIELEKSKIGNQDKQFLLQLAQSGEFAGMEDAYKRLALGQDQNQFMAKLAQEGQIAQLDDLFRRMQLAQQQSQFLDRLGFDVDQQRNEWDWKSRGNA